MVTWEQAVNRMTAALGYKISTEDVHEAAMMAFALEPPRAAGWIAHVKARAAEMRAAGWKEEDMVLSGIVSDRLARWYGYGNEARLMAWHALPLEAQMAALKRIRMNGKEGGGIEEALRQETKRLVFAYSGFSDKTEEFEDRVRWMEEEAEECENGITDVND